MKMVLFIAGFALGSWLAWWQERKRARQQQLRTTAHFYQRLRALEEAHQERRRKDPDRLTRKKFV